MQSERRMIVLRAVVEDYIRTQEPVGSTALTKNHQLRVSSATIRNDMAALEEEGYLIQPHISAGRVPTEKGYRYFVDNLTTLAPLTQAQRRGIRNFLEGSVSLEDTLRRAAKLLSQITGQVAVVASPVVANTRLRHLEIVGLAPHTILIVLINDNGKVEQRTLTTATPVTDDVLHEITRFVNDQCVNKPVASIHRALAALHATNDMLLQGFSLLLRDLQQVVDSIVQQQETDYLYTAGRSHMARYESSTLENLVPLFDALEEQVVLIKLMSHLTEDAAQPQRHGVNVAIGSEMHTPELLHTSVISAQYSAHTQQSSLTSDEAMTVDGGEVAVANNPMTVSLSHTQEPLYTASSYQELSPEPSPRNVAFVGTIGPTHMNYGMTMSAVKAVAAYLSEILSSHQA